jgi:hypothetical protein
MANIYVGTSISSSGEGSFLDVTITNSSGAAWSNPLISVIAKVGANYYTAAEQPVSVATAGSVAISMNIGTAAYSTATDYVHAGVAFVGTSNDITIA